MHPSDDTKFNTVINKNTFYFFNPYFEEQYEGYLNSLKETLLILKNDIETQGLKKELFENLLRDKENGLVALLALTGLSNETLKRLITIIRNVNNAELNRLVHKEQWCKDIRTTRSKEISDKKIAKLIRENQFFRKGIVNIFFEGSTIPFLIQTVPLFELKKLSISKLKFEIHEIIDTLIRYKQKGSYSGMKLNNPEIVIEEILENTNIPFQKGDLEKLIRNAPYSKRTMDFIIPDQQNPIVIIESSFLTTTSSGQGDKSKAEISVNSLVRYHYPNTKFIGFIDGIGWYVRKRDLRRMITAYEDVFTFHKEELKRFEKFLIKNL